jgi:hypothetical protein
MFMSAKLLTTTLCCLPLVLGAAIGSGAAVAMSGIVPVFVCLTVGIETAAAMGAIHFVYHLQKRGGDGAEYQIAASGASPPDYTPPDYTPPYA